MVDTISKIQQLLAESKFVEAQKEIESLLFVQQGQENPELIELYLDSLRSQSKPLPHHLIFLMLEKILPHHVDKAKFWVNELAREKTFEQQRLLLLEIQIAELRGLTDDLYKLITKYQIMRIEASTPTIPESVQILITKYFATDFQLHLQKLVMKLMLGDIASAEKLVIELILSCYEKSSLKGTKEKLQSLFRVLDESQKIFHLEIYKNLCTLLHDGIKEKKDYKKIIELVIYVENFKLQVLVLNLMKNQGLEEAAVEYSQVVRLNKDYSYVYLDKYFPLLKGYFFRKPQSEVPSTEETQAKIELAPVKSSEHILLEDEKLEISEEELLLTQLLKHQTFSPGELLDIAVSFLQSEFYLAASHASQMVYDQSEDEQDKLKACYLKVICLLKLGDYRQAVDISLQALSLSKTQNDVLSFLYSQAEAYLKMKDYKNARYTLKKIMAIDSSYRLAKERLEKLNAL